ncbi:MAG: hypothetical protein Q8R28_06520, partial [Dehalococcoidia bacterium]|nr:hypothetical protein [Dehalococcoidia bacterium]
MNQKMLDDVFARHNAQADKRGLTRYVQPIIAGTLDPNAKIAVETIELSSLPEGYDEEKKLKWYIAVLALGFQVEYQDLAPLPGGGLGTSTQSQTLHLKAKGKGPELFRKLLEHALNFHVLPQNANFRFTEEDVEAKGAEAQYRKVKADGRKLDIDSGVLTAKVARQIMVDEGDLREEYLTMLEQEDQENAAQAAVIAQGQSQTLGDQATQTGNTGTDETLGDQATGKALTETDYWSGPRTELENALEEDMATVLGQVRRRVEARLREEVKAAPDELDLAVYRTDKMVEHDAFGKITRVVEYSQQAPPPQIVVNVAPPENHTEVQIVEPLRPGTQLVKDVEHDAFGKITRVVE